MVGVVAGMNAAIKLVSGFPDGSTRLIFFTDGDSVNLVPIFEAIDTSAFKAMADAIERQDAPAFASAYRVTLDACYGCHKASGKPYLRPMIPVAPAQTIINVDPAATWPQ